MSSQPLLESAFKTAFCRQNLPSYGAVRVAEELGSVMFEGLRPPDQEGAGGTAPHEGDPGDAKP